MESTNMAKIPALTSLRFFAALAVLLFHFPIVLAGATGQALADIFKHGYVGVSFFFVLSGFLLTAIYLDRYQKGILDKKTFYKKRLIRILPAYYFALLVALPFLKANLAIARSEGFLPERLFDALLHATASQSLVPISTMRLHWLEPSWSISVEVFFYAAFPLLLPLLSRIKEAKLRTRIIALAMVIIVHAMVYVIAKHTHFAFTPDGQPTYAMTFPLFSFPTFFAGMFAATIPINTKASPALFASGIVLVGLFILRDIEVDPLNQSILLLGMTLIVLGASQLEGFTAKVLAFSPLIILGEASYSLYLIQRPVDMWLTRSGLLQRETNEFNLVVICVSIVASLLIWKFLEVPVNKWLLGRLSRKQARQIPVKES